MYRPNPNVLSPRLITHSSNKENNLWKREAPHTHTHKCPLLSVEQWDQDYVPLSRISPSRKMQLWSNHGDTSRNKEKVVAWPPSGAKLVINITWQAGEKTDMTLIMWPFCNKKKGGRQWVCEEYYRMFYFFFYCTCRLHPEAMLPNTHCGPSPRAKKC